MPDGTITVYNLGNLGVNVDKSPIHLDDGELQSAVNIIPDSTGSVGGQGGIRKRPGLIHYNALAGAGSMLGGIGLPVRLDVASIGGVATGVTRKIYWGRATTSANIGAAQGWWTSTDKFASAAGTISSGSPANSRASEISGFATGVLENTGFPSAACVVSNKLFYAKSGYTVGTDAPTIRVFDGTDDVYFVSVPKDQAATPSFECAGVLSMLAVNGVIYFTVTDQTSAGVFAGGRVFSLDPSSGQMIQLGGRFQTTYTPYALCWHANRLWCGTVYRQDASQAGTIHAFRPGIDTTWTTERTMASGRGVGTLVSYKGELLAGALGAGTIYVEKRSSINAWASTLSAANGGANSYWYTGLTFSVNSKAYMANFTPSTGSLKIYEWDGTTWTVRFTSSGASDNRPAVMSIVEDGTMLFGGGGQGVDTLLLSSVNGTAWTNLNANVSTATIMGLSTVGVLVT